MKETQKKVVGITLLIVILITMSMPSISLATTGEVTIKDSKLKEAIAEQVDYNKDGIITQEEIKELQSIEIPIGVTDLTGLEYAINLISIDLEYSKTMPDFSGLQVSSISLMISDVPDTIVKLDFLKKIKNLQYVSIFNYSDNFFVEVEYKDLKEIKTLKGLTFSRLTPDNYEEIGQISGLEQLNIIEVSRYGIMDLTGMEKLSKLSTLAIYNATIPGVSEISQLKNLSDLILEDVHIINDISSLANCTNLNYLYIRNTNIADISFLRNKTKLRSLSIYDSPIKDISVISTLTGLENLEIEVEGISLKSVEEYRNMLDKNTNQDLEDSSLPAYIDFTKNPETTSAENKTEAKKPTRIPQAGINVVEIVISLFVVMSVAILAVMFRKAKRK